MSKIIVFLVVAVAFCNQAHAEQPYSPFDEPKPRIAKEIMEDKRLDVKVNVFVKSKNLRDLFAEISKQTGVKLTADRDIAAERAIIYFHARPLRDVMTEVSGLFGYYWLPKGKPGAYTYELFEDSRHAVHRDKLRQGNTDAQDALLLALIKQSENPDSEALKRLAETNPGASEFHTGEYGKSLGKMYSKLGEPFLKQILAAGRSNYPFPELPPHVQAAFLEWWNAYNKANWDRHQTEGQQAAPFTPYTMADMAKASIQFNRIPTGMFGMPRLEMSMRTIQQGQSVMQWPYPLSEGDIRGATNQEPLPEKLIGDKLPDEPALTIPAKRKPTIILGDVLQGIAEQSGKDVIADYYFQEMYPQPASKEPLDKLVKRLCDELDYSCRADASTLTFRFNKWYIQPLQEEPPAKLLEAWWNKIETVGRLELYDLLDMASLPDKQMLWTGLRFMPGPSRARKSPATLRLWNSLRPELEAIARSEEGLSLDHLNDSQLDALYNWAKLMQVDPNADWSKAVIKISRREAGSVSGPGFTENVYSETFELKLPGSPVYQIQVMLPAPLSEQNRKELAAQRKADAEADKVEVVQ